MIEQLDTPITSTTEWGEVTLTHVSYSIEINTALKSGLVRKIYGKLSPEGDFIVYPHQHEIEKDKSKDFYLSKADVKTLLDPNDKGKKKNQFRTDDVLNLAKSKDK